MKKSVFRRLAPSLLALALGLLACGEQQSSEGNLGSETHWLKLCRADSECGSYSCECGVCSTTCAADNQCPQSAALCSLPGASAADALCESAASPPAGICLPTCSGDCKAGQSCVAGACVPTQFLAEEPNTAAAAPSDSSELMEPQMSMPVPEPTVSVGAGGSPAEGNSSEVGGTGGVTNDDAGPAGASGILDAGGPSVPTNTVVLRAVVTELFSGGDGIAAEWTNGTDQTIFLRGCATSDGWYFDGTAWIEYGAFAGCAAETPMRELGPGETLLDLIGAAAPPSRGTNLWRVLGPYGVGCTPAGARFSEAACAMVSDLQSVNEIAWAE